MAEQSKAVLITGCSSGIGRATAELMAASGHRVYASARNRAPATSYSEVTGITQTARNFGASLGLAVLGAVLIRRDDTNITAALTKAGVPHGVAHRVATSFADSASGSNAAAGQPHSIVHAVQLAFAQSTQTVFYIMAAVMAATFVFAFLRVPRGRVETAEEPAEEPAASNVPGPAYR